MARCRGLFRPAAVIAVVFVCASCSRSPTGPMDNTWRLFPGRVERFSVPAFRNNRPCWVYLPPGYAQSRERYSTLYVTDGEYVFDATGGMHVNRICEDLIRRREMRPLIVIAIGELDGVRSMDLSPWPDNTRSKPNGGGDVFLRAIRDTLKPAVDRKYRTLSDAGHTGIAGVSLGGLLAAYAGFAFDSTFGNVAAMSPSYWWAFGQIELFAKSRGRPRLLVRYYQDTGYPNDNGIFGMERTLLTQGFVLGRDLMSVTVEGAEHKNSAWEHRFPTMLRFIYPP